MQDPNNPDIFVDANDLVPQVNPADIPSAPPEGITDPEAIDQAAIDAAAGHVFRSTLEATGEAEGNEEVRQTLQGIMVGIVRWLHLEANHEWAELNTYHEKAVDAALRIRLGLIELLLQHSLLLEHLRRLRGPGLSLN